MKGARRWRWLQLLTGVHRIHHIRFAFGFKLPFVQRAYFPPWRVRDGSSVPKYYYYGWRRIRRDDYHDCTTTGKY